MFKMDGAHESPAKISIPILQDNYTKIPNAVMDSFFNAKIPMECRRVLDVVMRHSFGWNKLNVEMSTSKLSELTGIKQPNVVRCIKRLEGMNIITVNRSGHICSYGINCDVSQWRKKQKKNDTDMKIHISADMGIENHIKTENDIENHISVDMEIHISADNPLYKSKERKESKAKQSEKPLACFSFNVEKAQATAPATVPEPEPPAAAPPEPLAEIPATPVPLETVPVPAQTAKEVFQSLFDVAVPGNFHDLDAIAEMVSRKLAGKLNNVKNPLGYLNSLSGKVTSSVAPAPVQQTTSGVSFFVTETPRMDHADMAKINDIWDTMAMEERKLYEARALPKFEQQAGRYKTPLHLLAKGIFNTEQLQKHNTITTGIEM